MTIIAAADGSALGNPGPAGWAWYIDSHKWKRGGWQEATNNQAELMAVLSLLQETRSFKDEELVIFCDSQYVINSLTQWITNWKKNNWRKSNGKPVLNADLIRLIDAELQDRNVRFEWVKGHAGHPLNEKVDDLARDIATAFQNNYTIDEGPGFDEVSETKQFDVALQKNSGLTLF